MKKKLLIIGSALLIFVMIAVTVLIFQNKSSLTQRISDENTQAKLYLTPATGQFNVNSQIEATVMLDAPGNQVSGFETTLEYDASKLEYVSNEKLTSGFDTLTVNANVAGKIILVAEADPQGTLPSGNNIQVAKIRFTTKNASGNTTLSFNSSMVIGSTYTQILTSSGVTSTYQIGQSTTTATPTTTTATPSPTVTGGVTQPPTSANICLPIGDVNGDGSVTMADLDLLGNFIKGSAQLTPVQMNRANITGSTSSNRPGQNDYDRLKLLLEGKGSSVFPGTPPICPYVNYVFLGFSNNKVTLNSTNTTPTKNKIVIYNPEKKKIEDATIHIVFPSTLVRITKITPLNGRVLSQVNLSTQGVSFRVDAPATPTEVMEIAEIDVVPWTLGGGTSNEGEMRVEYFAVSDDGVAPFEEFRQTARYARVNYTVTRPGTSTTPSPTKTPTQIVTPTGINASPPAGGASLRIAVTLPAIGTAFNSDNKNPVRTQRPAQIQLVGAANSAPINASGTLTFNGSEYAGYVIIPNVAPGNYQIKVRLDGTLYKVIPGVFNLSDKQSVNTPTVKLVTGDFNQDQVLDLLDYNIMLACVQKKPACSQAMQILSDLNSDGKITEADYSIFIRQFDIREGD